MSDSGNFHLVLYVTKQFDASFTTIPAFAPFTHEFFIKIASSSTPSSSSPLARSFASPPSTIGAEQSPWTLLWHFHFQVKGRRTRKKKKNLTLNFSFVCGPRDWGKCCARVSATLTNTGLTRSRVGKKFSRFASREGNNIIRLPTLEIPVSFAESLGRNSRIFRWKSLLLSEARDVVIVIRTEEVNKRGTKRERYDGMVESTATMSF